MEVRHDNSDLAKMESDATFDAGFGAAIARSFRRKMNLVHQALDETELYQHEGLHLEKLVGDRAGQHSMKINDQFRLIVQFIPREWRNNNLCAVKEIVDYH